MQSTTVRAVTGFLRLLVNRAPNPVVVEREVPAPAFVDADGPA